MTFDFEKYDTVSNGDAGRWMPVVAPGNHKTDAAVCLYGSDGRVYNQAMLTVARAKIERMRAAGQTNLDPADANQDQDELLIACVKDWKGVTLAGAELPCTPDNVRTMFERFPWFKEQCSKFVHQRTNYLGN
jgi:hypothetical protein